MWKRKPVEVQLPERDARVLAKYERRAKRFDEMVKICCCYIGYDVLLDLIPVVGKIISLTFSLSMYRTACEADLPGSLKRRMLTNISIDFVVRATWDGQEKQENWLGLIPILGIVLTMLYRANTKNARMLRRFLYKRAAAQAKAAPKQPSQTSLNTDMTSLSATHPPPLPPRLPEIQAELPPRQQPELPPRLPPRQPPRSPSRFPSGYTPDLSPTSYSRY